MQVPLHAFVLRGKALGDLELQLPRAHAARVEDIADRIDQSGLKQLGAR
jgi:hypothetical protein